MQGCPPALFCLGCEVSVLLAGSLTFFYAFVFASRTICAASSGVCAFASMSFAICSSRVFSCWLFISSTLFSFPVAGAICFRVPPLPYDIIIAYPAGFCQ